MGIKSANKAYEGWLRNELKGDVVEDDLARKHKKMAKGPFEFLRATYWRWAETILDVCPDLADAPRVLAVGDIHLENFGTWRDVEGRLVWGVNDYDEAAEMPYLIDLVRLAASAVLAQKKQRQPLAKICSAVVKGYKHGLAAPQAFVLDREHMWLRGRFVVSEAERTAFWDKIHRTEQSTVAQRRRLSPPSRYAKALAAALPESGLTLVHWPRTAGTGSLGRPRWIGYGLWRGGPLLREAKALVASGWTRVKGRGSRSLRVGEIAGGKSRAPDPWYAQAGTLVVRRLSPNNRKLEIADRIAASDLLDPAMLWSMGRELAGIHLGQGERGDVVRADLDTRKRRWFRTQVEAATEFVRREQEEWRAG